MNAHGDAVMHPTTLHPADLVQTGTTTKSSSSNVLSLGLVQH
jgi:hypothetical protein